MVTPVALRPRGARSVSADQGGEAVAPSSSVDDVPLLSRTMMVSRRYSSGCNVPIGVWAELVNVDSDVVDPWLWVDVDEHDDCTEFILVNEDNMGDRQRDWLADLTDGDASGELTDARSGKESDPN